MKKKVIVLLIAAAVLGGLTYYFAKSNGNFHYAGTIEATEVHVSPRLVSMIAKLHADEGQTVKAGDPLADLTCEDVRVRFDQAQTDVTRAERLSRVGSMPQETYDHIKAAYDQARLQMDWCAIAAPISGSVLDRYREEGEWVSPGMRIFTLADLGRVWAMFYVEQPMLSRLALNRDVTGTVPEMPGKKFPGRITQIRDRAEFTPKNVQTREERTRLVYGIKVEFGNPDGILKPGMTLETKFE